MGKYDRLFDRAHKATVYVLMGLTGVGAVYVGSLAYDIAVNGPRVRR